MNTKRIPITMSIGLLVLILALFGSQTATSGQALPAAALASPVGTAFTYQGQLKSDGTPHDGTCDFQFGLWDAPSDGTQFGITLTKLNVSVNDGFFAVQLDWGASAFQGDARWLEISVRCPAGTGDYTLLTPRQPLTPTPYALYAAGTWRTTGNTGTTPGTHYLGTSDNVALELKVNGDRALRLEPNARGPNLIGGHSGNWVTSGVYGATIAGGGVSGFPNFVTDAYGTVGGGLNNQSGDNAGTAEDARHATVGGGVSNIASGGSATIGGGGGNVASGGASTVGGGNSNTAGDHCATVGGGEGNTAIDGHATIGGGQENTASEDGATVAGGVGNIASGPSTTVGGGELNTASNWYTTVGGGYSNTAGESHATVGGGLGNTANGDRATVSGGEANIASGGNATVGGGRENTAGAEYATISGGWANNATGNRAVIGGGDHNTASGDNATVPGGDRNLAQGSNSFAAGHQAKAYNQGCFVWADWNDVDLVCDVDNRWVARASGGVYFYTNREATTGVYLAAGGDSWNGVSDRAVKENLVPADGQAILETLASLPVQEYNLKSQDPSIRHIGPVAQDFAAFGYGESDTAINMQDADGVALAAIQGLYQQVQALEAENADLEARVTALEAAAGSSGGAHPWQWGLLPGLGLLAVGLVWVARKGEGQ